MMARPKTKWIKWTKEQERSLVEDYYKTDIEILMKRYGRNENAIRQKHKLLVGKTRPVRKAQVKLITCPNCGYKVNPVTSGYYCRHCSREYDLYGKQMAPILD